MNFPKIFTGEHIKLKTNCEVFKGKNIFVEFDRPCALQIDGETVLNVKNYKVESALSKEKVNV